MKTKTIISADGEQKNHLILIFDKDYSDGYRTVSIRPYLTTSHSFFKRVKIAIRYIFNFNGVESLWDDVIISKDNFKPLLQAVNFIKKSE